MDRSGADDDHVHNTASKTIEIIRHWFARYGLPLMLVSDNGPQFTASEFKDFLQRNGVKHTLTPPYHPSSNGAAERSVQIVKNGLKKHLLGEQRQVEPKLSTQHQLDNFFLTNRSTPQTITGRSPAELFLKREIRTRFSMLKPDLHKRVLNGKASEAEM
jgi:transposase InsO family protein